MADGVNTTLIYTLTANGSTLMEQCRSEKGHEMITMFTVDGDYLIATHYCSAKKPATDVDPGDHRCAEAVGVFACSSYRPEIAQ